MAEIIEKKESKTIQRLVHINNVERRKNEGWKIIKPHTDRHQQEGAPTDLVLMEKII